MHGSPLNLGQLLNREMKTISPFSLSDHNHYYTLVICMRGSLQDISILIMEANIFTLECT
jgi:hypothetical protein